MAAAPPGAHKAKARRKDASLYEPTVFFVENLSNQ